MIEHNLTLSDGSPVKITNKNQYLCCKFLKSSDETNWPRESKLAGKLLKKYPNFDFWLEFDLGFKVNCLAFFLTQKGKGILFLAYNHYNLGGEKPNHELGEKLGPDKTIDKKKDTKGILELWQK